MTSLEAKPLGIRLAFVRWRALLRVRAWEGGEERFFD
jgi:hypothetical protein